MDASIRHANFCCTIYLILTHTGIIFLSWAIYSREKFHSDIFIPTNCQINETLTQEIPCLLKKPTFTYLEINKLCKKTYYGIIYRNNIFIYFDQLPTSFSPIDAQNIRKFSGKSMNITCYYNRLNHMNIRWTKPDPKGFIQLILFSVVALCLTMIHCFDGCCYQRRSNRR